ncbi:MAG TPA: peptidase M16 [Desulfotomaculum sp.]|nr:peptidase M16 [Desulfotomaculum sp.]
MSSEIVLGNGLQIITKSISHVRSIAVGIWVDAGSRYEAPSLNGISHFIEHLMFKGTARRTARQIAEALDEVGGQLNAFTTKEYTCYYARVLDEHFNLVIDVLNDMLFHSRFEVKDIDQERKVIIEEIKTYEDVPEELVHDLFTATIWPGHSLGRSVIGNQEVISNLSRQDIINFYQKYYVPGNIVIAVVGNFQPEIIIEKLEKTFGGLKGKTQPRSLVCPTAYSSVNCYFKDTELVHLCFGTQGLPFNDEKTYVFQLINIILGTGLSSRLFQEIREQRGLVYSIYSYPRAYRDTGLFGIYAGLSKENIATVITLIIKEIKKIQADGVSELELQRAKNHYRGNLLLSLESVIAQLGALGKSQLYLGRVISPEEVLEKINRVTREEIKEAANELLKTELFTLASIGPVNNGNALEKSIRETG